MAASSPPEERIALTHAAWDAYAAGDLERVLSVFDPAVVVHVPTELGNPGTFRGHQGFLEWLGAWQEAWERFELETIDAVSVGDYHVVCHMEQTGVGRGSGIEVTQRLGWLFEVRDLRTVYIELRGDFDSAVAAAREREESSPAG
jgi:ketosteroid isomerase-like protein